MAFLIHSVDDGHVPAWEYLPCAAITPKVGMALALSAGLLTTASGTTAPRYICMAERDAACAAGVGAKLFDFAEDPVNLTGVLAEKAGFQHQRIIAVGGVAHLAVTGDSLVGLDLQHDAVHRRSDDVRHLHVGDAELGGT